MSNPEDLYTIVRELMKEPVPTPAPQAEAPASPVVTPALTAFGAPAQSTEMGPLASSIGASAPNNGSGNLLTRTREAVAQSHLPSEGENLRQQMMALGAAMASSQQRTFGGAFGEGVAAMQRHQGQQRQEQRQLLETEAQAQYREAQIRVQQAQIALAENPDSPENRARLMQAEAAMLAAQARMASAASGASATRVQSGQYVRGENGEALMLMRDGSTQPVMNNGRPVPYENVLAVQAQQTRGQPRVASGDPFIGPDGRAYTRLSDASTAPFMVNNEHVTAQQYARMRDLGNIDAGAERARVNAQNLYLNANRNTPRAISDPQGIIRDAEAAGNAAAERYRQQVLRGIPGQQTGEGAPAAPAAPIGNIPRIPMVPAR